MEILVKPNTLYRYKHSTGSRCRQTCKWCARWPLSRTPGQPLNPICITTTFSSLYLLVPRNSCEAVSFAAQCNLLMITIIKILLILSTGQMSRRAHRPRRWQNGAHPAVDAGMPRVIHTAHCKTGKCQLVLLGSSFPQLSHPPSRSISSCSRPI